MRSHRIALVGILCVMALACGGQAPGGDRAVGQPRSTASDRLPTSVRIAVSSETDMFSPKLGGRTNAAEFNFLMSSPLVLLDEHGAPSPLLAAEQPSRDNGTWVVNPDGTMTTTWHIRDNAKWHDGQPVTAQDFVFAR